MCVLGLAAVGSVISRCCMHSPEHSLCAAWGFVLHHCRYWSHKGHFCRLYLGKATISFAAWLPVWEGCSLQCVAWHQGFAFGSWIRGCSLQTWTWCLWDAFSVDLVSVEHETCKA